MNKEPGRERYRVIDRERLAALVQRAIDERFGGSQIEAARATQIPQSALSLLVNGKTDSISPERLQELMRLLPDHAEKGQVSDPIFSRPREEFRRELTAALLSTTAQALLAAAEGSWEIEQHLTRTVHPSRKRWTGTDAGLVKTPDTEIRKHHHYPARRLEHDYLRRYVRVAFPDLYGRFERFLISRGHSRHRRDLAWTRVLGPLLQYRETGFIERDWTELRDTPAGKSTQLKQFIELGMKREELLLDRAPDEQRAQDIAARDPATLAEPDWPAMERDLDDPGFGSVDFSTRPVFNARGSTYSVREDYVLGPMPQKAARRRKVGAKRKR